MTRERQKQIHDAVSSIFMDYRARNLTAEKTIAACEDRLRRDFPILEEHAFALGLLKQFLRRNPPEYSNSSSSTTPWERWKVVRDDDDSDLLGDWMDINPVDITKNADRPDGAPHCTVHEALDKRVTKGFVVKCLRDSGLFTDAQKIASTIRAIRDLNDVVHPNIVRVYNGGMLQRPHSTRKYPFILMEQVKGCTLETWRKSNRRFSPATPEERHLAAEAVEVLAKAVDVLHSQKPPIIHFDLKPENVMVSGGVGARPDAKHLKIIDFTVFGREESQGQVATAAYAMPGRDATDDSSGMRSDVFALGAILFFMVTGEHPMISDAGEPVVDLSRVVDLDLRAVVRMASTRGSDGTFADYSAKQLAEDLHAARTCHPLPHARNGEYSWWDREKLLLRRLASQDDQRDHAQAAARLAIPTGVAVAANGLFHSLFVYSGMAPEVAVTRANLPTLGLCSTFFLALTIISRRKLLSAKILEPLYALIMSCLFLTLVIVPQRFGPNPAWESYNVSINIVILIFGVILVCFGALSPEWRSLRRFGWSVVLTAPVWRYVFNSTWSDYAGPVVCGILEAIACFLFARLLWRGEITVPEAEPVARADRG